MLNRFVVFTTLLGGFFALILSFILELSILSLFSLILFFLTLVIWKYGYILIPFFTRAVNIIEIRDQIIIPPTRNYIIKKTEEGYFVTKFLQIIFHESALEKGNDSNFFQSFEKLITSFKYPIKISFLFSPVDMSKYIDEVKSKRSEAEAKLNNPNLTPLDKNLLEREILMWNRILKKLSSGEKPMELIVFLSTTSFSTSKEDALSQVNRQIQELKTIISSTLSAEVKELSDNEMIKCIEWTYFIPPSNEDLRDELF